jgi:hypothetical protein
MLASSISLFLVLRSLILRKHLLRRKRLGSCDFRLKTPT